MARLAAIPGFLQIATVAAVAIPVILAKASTCDGKATCSSDFVSLLQPRVSSDQWLTSHPYGQVGHIERHSFANMQQWMAEAFPKPSPLPLLMAAVLGLVFQYFIAQTLRSMVHGYKWLYGGGQRLETALELAAVPVASAPMLCTLFLAPWFQAMRLTGSLDPSQFELPQLWLEIGMVVCSVVLILKAFLHFVGGYLEIELVTKGGGASGITKSGVDVGLSLIKTMCSGVQVILNATVIFIYIGTIIMAPRYEPGEDMKRMNTGVFNNLLLSCLYFAVQIIVQIRSTVDDARKEPSLATPFLNRAMDVAKLVPMLCLLFQSVGMHALEQDPPAGQPPTSVRICMNIAAYSLFASVSLNIVRWLLSGLGSNARIERLLETIRVFLRLAIFAASFCVCASIWADPRFHKHKRNKEDADDPQDLYDSTAFASDMVLSVVLIATLYFGAHFIFWISELTGPDTNPNTVQISATVFRVLEICPMSAALIVVLRLRSLQLGSGLGEPDENIERCMYFLFFGILGRLLCSLLGVHNIRRDDSSLTENGQEQSNNEATSPEPKNCSSFVEKVVRGLHIVCTVMLYLSVFTMLIGCVYMRQGNMQELKRPFGQFKKDTAVLASTTWSDYWRLPKMLSFITRPS